MFLAWSCHRWRLLALTGLHTANKESTHEPENINGFAAGIWPGNRRFRYGEYARRRASHHAHHQAEHHAANGAVHRGVRGKRRQTGRVLGRMRDGEIMFD